MPNLSEGMNGCDKNNRKTEKAFIKIKCILEYYKESMWQSRDWPKEMKVDGNFWNN